MPHSQDRGGRNQRRSLPFATNEFVCVTGAILRFAAEKDPDPINIDHFWITIDAGIDEEVQISINTASRSNRAAGFDPRPDVAVVTAPWTALPETGIRRQLPFDYGKLEMPLDGPFASYERETLERLLAEKSGRAILVEAWGELYARTRVGIHQVHSRRASCSVSRDIVGQDGAIRFFYADRISEMLLFKFCGQP